MTMYGKLFVSVSEQYLQYIIMYARYVDKINKNK